MHRLTELLTSSHERFQHLGWLGVLAYAAGIVLLQMVIIPLAPVAVAAGGGFGFLKGFVAITLGTNGGAAVNFLVSRYIARNAVNRWLGHHEKFRLIDAAIGREGWKIIALLRLCPLPFGLANYAYGLTAVRFWPYFFATFVAIIPANIFFVWLGSSAQQGIAAATGAQHARTPGEWALTGIGLVAFFIALRHITKLAKSAVTKGEPRIDAGN
jgi:uncharacterized membrane protein YdjX (TVP38/TMEM64 family)